MQNNNFLLSVSRLLQNWFYATGSLYGITTMSASVGQIKSAVCAKFTEFYRYVCMLFFYRSLLIVYFICILLLLRHTWHIKPDDDMKGAACQSPNYIRKTKNTFYEMKVSVPFPPFCEKLLPRAKFH